MATDRLRFRLSRMTALAALALALTACANPTPASLPSATPLPIASPTTGAATAKPTPGPTALASDLPCAVEGPWSVELVVSGGIAGIQHKVEVDSSGAYQVEDVQTGEKVEGTLPAEALQQIEGDLPGVCHTGDSGRPPNCADCFQYSLEVTLGGEVYRLVFNDVSLPQSPAAALVQDLTQLIAQTIGP